MKNTVELIGTYGDDLTHALSAWTSTSRDLTDDKQARVGKLLTMLAKDEHHSPFEKSSQHFLLTTDLSAHIHMLKHRIGVSCVTGDTLIPIKASNGKIKLTSIKSIYEKYHIGIATHSKNGKDYIRRDPRKLHVKSMDEKSGMIIRAQIDDVFFNGIKDVFRITTSNGYSIKCTKDHMLYTEHNGWMKLSDAVGLEFRNGTAGFTIKNVKIASNGTREAPWRDRSYFDDVENKMTRIDAAKYLGMSYANLKKWGYFHKIQFLIDPNQYFQSGHEPWNKNFTGYKAPRAKNGIKKISTSDEGYSSYKSWRAAVGNWTRDQLPTLLKKYNYTCQGNLNIHSRDFVCHHIVPVSVDPELSCSFDNLVLLCSDCHKAVHANMQATTDFANHLNATNIKTFSLLKPRVGNKLRVKYTEIVSIEYIGEEDVYDLNVKDYHNYVANGLIMHNCNSESARYKELKENKYYIPIDWSEDEQARLVSHCEEALAKYHECLTRLVANGVSRKRAKESARFYLPYANQLTIDVMFNFRSFMHFVNLRNSEHAQLEIRQIAQRMLELISETGKFDQSLDAFGWTKERIAKEGTNK